MENGGFVKGGAFSFFSLRRMRCAAHASRN
jgi:hypothetical protein